MVAGREMERREGKEGERKEGRIENKETGEKGEEINLVN